MKDTKSVVLLVMDEKENFESEPTQSRIGKELWKDVIQVSNKSEFEKVFSELEDSEEFIFACHLFHAKSDSGIELRGYYNLVNSNIENDFNITAQLVSSGDSKKVSDTLYSTEQVLKPVYLYSSLRNKVITGEIKTENKGRKNIGINQIMETKSIKEIFDFGIITALYKDEFNMIEDLFIWTDKYQTGRKSYQIGHPKSDPLKKVVAVHLTETGMIDASVIATQMAELFKPKVILMPGVCGGDESTGIGDVIVAKKVFMFQKGKISDIKDGDGEIIKIYDNQNNEIDINTVKDGKGEKVNINVEKFEIEQNSICELDSQLKDELERVIENIKYKINKEISPYGKNIEVYLEPMACSTMVINKKGYFEKNVSTIDRKVIALEMESYGLARACQFANQGKTAFLIFKSVMDNMHNKEDGNKSFAGKTSALFLKYLLEEKVLDKSFV